ncbi:hypothetical protein Tco_0105243 [Tanacetum coccineum]
MGLGLNIRGEANVCYLSCHSSRLNNRYGVPLGSEHSSTTTNVATSVDLGHNVNEVQQINENTSSTSAKHVVTSTQPASSSLCAEEDSEGDVENAYDETGTFMASGSGYGAKSLYERRKGTNDDDPYDYDHYFRPSLNNENGGKRAGMPLLSPSLQTECLQNFSLGTGPSHSRTSSQPWVTLNTFRTEHGEDLDSRANATKANGGDSSDNEATSSVVGSGTNNMQRSGVLMAMNNDGHSIKASSLQSRTALKHTTATSKSHNDILGKPNSSTTEFVNGEKISEPLENAVSEK